MGNRARTRSADRAGSHPTCIGRRACGPTRASRDPHPAQPNGGTFAGFASIKTAPKAGLYSISLSGGGWVDVVQDGHFLKPKAFSGATDCDGIRKTMKYELSASPIVLQVSGTKEDSISIAVLPTE